MDATPEGTGHPDLDVVLIGWPWIASLAWQGFMTHGRGAVVIEITASAATWAFHPCGPCSCFTQAVETYNPEQQVVVGVVRDGGKAIYILGGWPAPPEAFIAAPVQVLDATIH